MTGAPTIDAAIATARAKGLDRLDAHLLLAHLLARTRTWLIAHADAALEPAQAAAFDALVDRRAAGVPLAYLVGTREFHGLELAVAPGVLVPRPDTETLVDWALELLRDPLGDRPCPRVIDLGTGSGAIALAVKAACPRAEVWATERSPAALEIARANARRLGLDIRFVAGDWWQALDGAGDAPAFDLAVSNPPYIAPGDPHLPALGHEPLEALVADDDGLADIARLCAGAPNHLAAQGWLLFEHGWEQAEAVRAMLDRAGFTMRTTRLDLEQRPRCTGGRLEVVHSRNRSRSPSRP